MGAIAFLFKRKIINWFRQLLYNKSKLIMMIVWGSIILFGFGFTLFGSFMSSQEPPEPGEPSSAVMTSIIMAITWTALVIFMIVQGLYQGTKRGSSVYSSADIQFLFTGPVRTQTVLIYGMLNSLQSVLISTFFMIYQIPNMLNMGLGASSFVLFIFSWFLVVMIAQLATMSLYLLLLPHPNLAGVIRGIVLVMPLVLAGIYILMVLNGSGPIEENFGNAFTSLITSPWLLAMPLIGWGILLMNGVFTGATLYVGIAMALLILSGVLMTVYISRSEADYYEDAMTLTYERETQLSRQKSGQIARVKKVRKTGLNKGWGADAFFYRQLREFRRQRPAVIGPATLFYLFAAGGVSAMLNGLASENEFNPNDFSSVGITIVFVAIVAVLFWHGMFSSLLSELESPVFYTAPAGAVSKLIHASRLGVLKISLDMLPGLILAVILLRAGILTAILLYLACVSLFLVISGAQLLVYRLMGQVKGTLEAMVLIFLQGIMLIPTLILTIVAFVLMSQGLLGTAALPLLLIAVLNTGLFFSTLPAGISLLERGLDK